MTSGMAFRDALDALNRGANAPRCFWEWPGLNRQRLDAILAKHALAF